MKMEDKSVLLEYFGESPTLRILDFLLENRLFDYSKTQIVEGAGIGKATFYKYWDNLEQKGMVKVTRAFGKTRLYKLNEKSPVVRKIMEIELAMIEEAAPKKVKAIAAR